ncbi:hypothetical protein EBR43_06500 [bacterium]|nr:hypothetical protein [bacterium]
MDLSQWLELKPDLLIVPTRCKFYRKFVHKLSYDLIEGAFAIPGSQSIEEIEKRLSYSRRTLSFETKKHIHELFEIYRCRKNYRMRFEGSSFSIFSNDLEELFAIASRKIPDLVEKISFLSTIVDSNQQQALEKDQIILKKPISYTHRVTVREGFYLNYNERNALAQYILNLGNQVRISKKYILEIKQGHKYLQSGYFYVQDPRIVDMIRLIIPSIVRSIQEVVVH